MIKLLIGMLKMKGAFKKLSNENLATYPYGYQKFADALSGMGEMGKQIEIGMLLFLMQ